MIFLQEIYPPDVAYFARTTDNAYTTIQITEMELKLLKVIVYRKKKSNFLGSEVAMYAPNIEYMGELVYEPVGFICRIL